MTKQTIDNVQYINKLTIHFAEIIINECKIIGFTLKLNEKRNLSEVYFFYLYI